MENQEQHSTLVSEPVEMQQLPQGLQDAIHMTTENKLRALCANAAGTTNLEAPTPPISATDVRTSDGTTTQSFESEEDDNTRSASSYIKPGDLPDSSKFDDEHQNDEALK
ncbi:hypothetical protein ACJ72_07182 [Emergomyces africanus]|uniref:Uncharacterized protein n=1 Tax=Emergomyces africanus TaxID=1955775 RepID=A0A1B7NP02_9EURO|nr:hypothetical protein ACJ72_07182 [Emergomyces africanus]